MNEPKNKSNKSFIKSDKPLNKSNKSVNKSDKSDLNQNKSDKSDLNQNKSINRFNESYIPVFEITPAGNGNITTVLTLIDTILTKNKNYIWSQSNAGTIAEARTEVFLAMKKTLDYMGYKENKIRGFIIDSDIVLHPKYTDTLIKNINLADELRYSFVVPYRVNDETDIIKPDGTKLSFEEYNKIDNLSTVYAAGLGFYYGDIILDYQFHYDKMSEDINYMVDNKIEVRLCKEIELYHTKKVMLGMKGNVYL